MKDLEGQTTLVTGALGDIGSAVTATMLQAGSRVVGIGRASAESARSKVEQIRSSGDFEYVSADVTDTAALSAVVAALPRLDIVVGNAGIVEPMPFVEVTAESLERTIATNLTANFILGQLAARRFQRDGTPGRIIYIGSWVGDRPWPEISAYSATKAALQMLARSMALELAASGIRVNVVAPGIVNAGLARAEAERNPEYAARAAKAVPLGYLQRPEEVADLVLFLAGPRAGSVTGATFLLDGGSSLGTF